MIENNMMERISSRMDNAPRAPKYNNRHASNNNDRLKLTTMTTGGLMSKRNRAPRLRYHYEHEPVGINEFARDQFKNEHPMRFYVKRQYLKDLYKWGQEWVINGTRRQRILPREITTWGEFIGNLVRCEFTTHPPTQYGNMRAYPGAETKGGKRERTSEEPPQRGIISGIRFVAGQNNPPKSSRL